MTYNTDRRKPLTKKQREQFLIDHDSICYFCKKPITNDEWDDEHIVAKELMAPGSDWNAMSNRAPIHRIPCHKIKTAPDIKAIAKSNRIRRKNGPVEYRKKPKVKLKTRSFSRSPIKQKIPSRPFPQKEK